MKRILILCVLLCLLISPASALLQADYRTGFGKSTAHITWGSWEYAETSYAVNNPRQGVVYSDITALYKTDIQTFYIQYRFTDIEMIFRELLHGIITPFGRKLFAKE